MQNIDKRCPFCRSMNEYNSRRCKICGKNLPVDPSNKSTTILQDLTADGSSQIRSSTPADESSHNVPIGVQLGAQSPPRPRKKVSKRMLLLSSICLLVLLGVVILSLVHFPSGPPVTPTPTPSPLISALNRLGEIPEPGGQKGQMIGVNDGSDLPFDTGRLDDADKKSAYQALKNGDTSGAITAWANALKTESNDAETLIYKENLLIANSGANFVSVAIGVAFDYPVPNKNLNLEDEQILQGAYVAQHTFNQTHALQIRLFIANAGSNLNNVSLVAQQLVNVVQKQRLIAVMGWMTSAYTFNANQILGPKHIPLISPTATSDELTNLASNFFRVVPPDSVQAKFSAQYAVKTLNATSAVVFLDEKDPYSQNLASDFEADFTKDGGKTTYEEKFKNGHDDFVSQIRDALKHEQAIFYFTSPLTSDTAIFEDALPDLGLYPNLHVLAGDAGYSIQEKSHGRLYFTGLAFADAWNIAFNNKQSNPFFQDYSNAFDPEKQHAPGIYEFERPSADAILAYDASNVILLALQKSAKSLPAFSDILNALPQITGKDAYQGVSGQVDFGPDHDPRNKALFMIYADPDGHSQEVDSTGCYIKGNCS